MASQVGRNTPADILLSAAGGGATTSYKAQFSFFSVRMVVPQGDVSTFATEPAQALEPGEVITVVTFSGFLQTGAGALNPPLLPPPQKVTGTWQFAPSCTVATNGTSGWWNFDDTLAARPVNTNATLAGTARSSGTVIVSWA